MTTRQEKKARDLKERLRDESVRKSRHDKERRQQVFGEPVGEAPSTKAEPTA